MGIKANFTQDDVRKRFDAFLEQTEKKQIVRLRRLGEMCMVEARRNGSYMDRTGNLRSSIGYGVFVDGVAIHKSDFPAVSVEPRVILEQRMRKKPDGSTVLYDAKVKIGGNGGSGVKSGSALVEEIGKETKGVALVVVAGMNYASYVEAKGHNVLSSAEHLAERELPRMLDKLITDIKRTAE